MYQGGKTRTAPHIARALASAAQGRTRYLEPFVGGGSVLVRVPATWQRTAADNHPDLILMWQAVQTGWTPPHHVTPQTYARLRREDPSPLRGFVGYACSWGAKWFGGYGRHQHLDLAETTARWLVNHRAQIADVTFTCADYRDHHPGPDTLVYCDPPYTDTYGYRGTRFDTDTFWEVCQTWVEAGAAVVVSEFSAPDMWIDTRTRTRYLSMEKRARKQENLYRHVNEYQPSLGDIR